MYGLNQPWSHAWTTTLKPAQLKQVDILISKNQALQILYLKHTKLQLHKLATMNRNPRKF